MHKPLERWSNHMGWRTLLAASVLLGPLGLCSGQAQDRLQRESESTEEVLSRDAILRAEALTSDYIEVLKRKADEFFDKGDYANAVVISNGFLVGAIKL